MMSTSKMRWRPISLFTSFNGDWVSERESGIKKGTFFSLELSSCRLSCCIIAWRRRSSAGSKCALIIQTRQEMNHKTTLPLPPLSPHCHHITFIIINNSGSHIYTFYTNFSISKKNFALGTTHTHLRNTSTALLKPQIFSCLWWWWSWRWQWWWLRLEQIYCQLLFFGLVLGKWGNYKKNKKIA